MDLQVGVVLPFEQFVWGRDRDSLNKPPWMRRMGMKPVPTEGLGSRLRGNDEGSLILTLPTVCAVAHLDASLRWHDGGALLRSAVPSPVGEPRYTLRQGMRGSRLRGNDEGSLILTLPTVCAVRTWMPAFAGMTEGRYSVPPCRRRWGNPATLSDRDARFPPARERRGRTPRPVTLILAFSPQGRRDLSLRGNDEGAHPAPSPSS